MKYEHLLHQPYFSESTSASLNSSNYLQNQGSNLVTITETHTDPLLVVKEFKPHFYDLLLTDINMPSMNGFELCEKILELDVNIRICFMTAFVINIRALREVYMNVSFGCFIEKPSINKILD